MECPYCGNNGLKVTDKRASGFGIRRRRECLKCKKRFTTHEKIESIDLYVVKKDNSREKYNREKFERGIQRAFEKRPISKEKIKKLDNVAYIRFASVYRNFQDVEDFKNELRELKNE